MKYTLFRILPLMMLMLASCTPYQANQQADAAKMLDRLYAAIDQQDWDTALSLYGKRFFKEYPREHWKKQLQELRANLGHVKGRELNFSQRDAKYRYDAYIFSYTVHYEKGDTRDLITIYKAVDEKTGLHIVAHVIKPLKHS